MKTTILFLTALVAFTGLSPADQPATTVAISRRLNQIDLDVAIRHYEKLQAMLREARLELNLAQDSRQEPHPVVQQLEWKLKVIHQAVEMTRQEIIEMGSRVEEAGPPAVGP